MPYLLNGIFFYIPESAFELAAWLCIPADSNMKIVERGSTKGFFCANFIAIGTHILSFSGPSFQYIFHKHDPNKYIIIYISVLRFTSWHPTTEVRKQIRKLVLVYRTSCAKVYAVLRASDALTF